jgi:hypothetical protein
VKTLDVGHIVKALEDATLCFDCERLAVSALLDLLRDPVEFARFDWPARDRYVSDCEGLA